MRIIPSGNQLTVTVVVNESASEVSLSVKMRLTILNKRLKDIPVVPFTCEWDRYTVASICHVFKRGIVAAGSDGGIELGVTVDERVAAHLRAFANDASNARLRALIHEIGASFESSDRVPPEIARAIEDKIERALESAIKDASRAVEQDRESDPYSAITLEYGAE